MANTHSLDLEVSSSQYAWIADTASLSITGDISIELWIKLEQLPSTAGTLFALVGKNTNFTDTYSYELAINTANKISFVYANSSFVNITAWKINTALTAGDVGVWRHIAVTVDVSAATILFYIDGSEVAATASLQNATSIEDNATPFMIGVSEGKTSRFFDGLIDDIRLWSDIRTPTEISDNKSVELVGNEANLNGYWKLNNDYLDETANNNDLAGVGSPVFSVDVPFTGGGGPSIIGWRTLLGVGQG